MTGVIRLTADTCKRVPPVQEIHLLSPSRGLNQREAKLIGGSQS